MKILVVVFTLLFGAHIQQVEAETYEPWNIRSGVGLACTMKLCLFAVRKPSACRHAMKEYLKKLWKGDARSFIRSCPDGDVDSRFTNFALRCTNPAVFRYLYEQIPTGDNCLGCSGTERGEGMPDVPEACKDFLRDMYAEEEALLKTIPEDMNIDIPSLALLPIRVSGWVMIGNPSDVDSDVYLALRHEWLYIVLDTGEYDLSAVPEGYAITYDVNLIDDETGELGVYYEDPPCPRNRKVGGFPMGRPRCVY